MNTDEALTVLWLTRHDDDTADTYAAAVSTMPVGHFHAPDTVCLSCCTRPCFEPAVYPTDIAVGSVGPDCAVCDRPVCTPEQIAAATAWAEQHP